MLTRRTLAAVLLATAPPSQDPLIQVTGHTLAYGNTRLRCAIGRTGIGAAKREGDGATPAGTYLLREVLYRPDRGPAPATRLPVSRIAPADGWSDDPADPAYNRRATTPAPFHREPLWRQDALYDVLAVIGANDDPPIPGRGSAIFLHVARPGLGPTDGCIALPKPALLRLLEACTPATTIQIAPG